MTVIFEYPLRLDSGLHILQFVAIHFVKIDTKKEPPQSMEYGERKMYDKSYEKEK